MAIVCIVWQKLAKKRKTKTIFDLQKHCLNEKPKAGYPTVAKPKRLNKNKCMFFFSCVFIFHFLFIVSSIMFNSVHFFSLVVQCSHLFSCCSFLFISCIFLLLKNNYQSRPLACRPTTYFCWNIAFEKCIYIYIHIYTHIYRWFSCFPAPTKTPFCIGSCCLLLFIIFIGMLCYVMLCYFLCYLCMIVYIYSILYIYISTCMYACACLSVCIYIIYIYIYTYTLLLFIKVYRLWVCMYIMRKKNNECDECDAYIPMYWKSIDHQPTRPRLTYRKMEVEVCF